MKDIIVKVRAIDVAQQGTGFFISPRLVLTASHVLRAAGTTSDAVSVVFEQGEFPATIEYVAPPDSEFGSSEETQYPDIAVLRLESDVAPWSATFDTVAVQQGEMLQSFGFPIGPLVGGEPTTIEVEGIAAHDFGFSKPVLKLKQGQVRHGMSGAPLYRGTPPVVVGMITMSRRVETDLGAFATPATELIRRLQEIYTDIQVREEPLATATDVDVMAVPSENAAEAEAHKAISAARGPGIAAPRDIATIVTLIDRATAERRQGRPNIALGIAREAVANARDISAPTQILGRALRTHAIALAEAGFDPAAARALADEAKNLDPNRIEDERVEATLAMSLDGPRAALTHITPGLSAELEVLRVGYLLGEDKEEAARILAAVPPSEAEKPRARKLRVLLALLDHNRNEALRTAEGLVVASRDDASIAFTVVAALVYGSIPPAFWRDPIRYWPEPVPRAELITDDQQPERLRTAAEIAKRLLDDTEVDGAERATIQIWRLAALSLDDERRPQAEEYATSLLADDPPNYRALSWIWFLGLQVETSETLAFLRHLADRGEATGEQVIALVVASFIAEKYTDAEALITANMTSFRNREEIAKSRLFLFESVLLGGDASRAETLLADITDSRDRVAAKILLYEKSGDFRTAHTRIYDLWTETRDPRALLGAAEIAHINRDWVFLADHGGEFIQAIGNESTARFAIYGAFNSQRYDDAVEHYARYSASGVRIPVDVMHVRALALERLGDPAAPQAFDDLLERAPVDANFYSAGYARLRRGDLSGVVRLGRDFLQSSDLTARTAFAFASWIRPADLELARTLWRAGIALGAPEDDLILLAFSLAHQLGISAEAAVLQEPLARLGAAGEGGVHAVTQEQALEVLREHAKRSADIFTQYRRGRIPIHMLCAGTNADLVATHVEQPRANAEVAPDRAVPVFVRHGSRTMKEAAGAVRGSAMLDATSFLIASDFGVLDLVIDAHGPIAVSSRLGALLSSALDDRAPHQPNRMRALRDLVAGVDEGRIALLEDDGGRSIDERAIQQGMFLIDWSSPPGLEAHASSGVDWCSPRRLIDALLRQGRLGETAHAAAVTSLGNIQDDAGSDPAHEVPLLLRWNVAEIVVEAGLLIALRGRRLTVESRYVASVRAELRRAGEQERVAQWIRERLEVLHAGITGGRIYTVDPPSAVEEGENLETVVVLSAFSTRIREDGFIVVDDRYFNAYRSRDDGKPVVSLHDMLRHMSDAGTMTSERYSATTMEMRRRGLMYLPIEAAEIARIVTSAPVVEGQLVVTEEMRVLAHYVAMVLLDREALGAPSEGGASTDTTDDPGASQAPYLLELSQAIRRAISQLLESGAPQAEARATWVRDALAVDGLPGFGISAILPTAPAAQSVIDTDVAGFLFQYLAQ